ncbi:MAG: glycosyltransferase family 9 protein [Nitrospinae bacterium]|nr:glycosyltransferase family 9 protein [Nitrospinota bacterium]
MKKALLIRNGGLGDTLLTLSAACFLKDKGFQTSFMGPSKYRHLVDGVFGIPFIAEEMAEFESAYSEPSKKLSGALNGFGVVVAVKADADGSFIKNLAQAAPGHVIRINPLPPENHDGLYHLFIIHSLAEKLGIDPPDITHYPEPVIKWSQSGNSGLVIHTGSGSAKKDWPSGHIRELALEWKRRAGGGVTLVFGPAEMGRAAQGALEDLIRSGVAEPLFEPPLDVLAVTLAGAAVVVGADSGVTHLSAMIGAPTVALFGPTKPEIWGPLGPRVEIMKAPEGRMELLKPTMVFEKLFNMARGVMSAA